MTFPNSTPRPARRQHASVAPCNVETSSISVNLTDLPVGLSFHLASRQGEQGFPRLVCIDDSSPNFVREVPTAKPAGRSATPFDAIPKQFHDDIIAGWMPAMASTVLVVMLRFAFGANRRGYGDGRSTWASNAAVGIEIGRSARQVGNIRKAILARGWLHRESVGPSDPIDPRNRTGERWHFTWMTGELPTLNPAEPPPLRAKRGRPLKGTKLNSTPPRNEFLPPPRVEMNYLNGEKFISTNVIDQKLKVDDDQRTPPREGESSSPSNDGGEGEAPEADRIARPVHELRQAAQGPRPGALGPESGTLVHDPAPIAPGASCGVELEQRPSPGPRLPPPPGVEVKAPPAPKTSKERLKDKIVEIDRSRPGKTTVRPLAIELCNRLHGLEMLGGGEIDVHREAMLALMTTAFKEAADGGMERGFESYAHGIVNNRTKIDPSGGRRGTFNPIEDPTPKVKVKATVPDRNPILAQRAEEQRKVAAEEAANDARWAAVAPDERRRIEAEVDVACSKYTKYGKFYMSECYNRIT